MSKRVPKIELLLSPGCAHTEEAVELVNNTLRDLGVNADVSEVVIDTKEMAQEMEFLGSPTIRVNGRDIEPGAEDRQDYDLGCRLYVQQDGTTSKVVPKQLFLRALQEY